MGKVVLAILIGLVGAAIVHLAVIFAMPSQADDSAWNRLSAMERPFQTQRLETGASAVFSFMDPAFEISSCRFNIGNAPVRITAEQQPAFWTASIFTRTGDNIYSINQRAALDDRLDLVLGTASQFDDLRIAGLFDSETSIFVPFEADDGFVVLRGSVESPSLSNMMRDFVQTLVCAPEALPEE